MNPIVRSHSRSRLLRSCLTANALAVSLLLSACGGGGGGGDSGGGSAATGVPAATPAASTSAGVTPSAFLTQTFADLHNVCANPRTGTAPDGTAYTDRQGTLLDELNFLHVWSNEQYLWYNEIPASVHQASYTSAIAYFDALKTPALTPAGAPKDRFHFTYSTDEWNALNDEGKETGYGVMWATGSTTPPRSWRVADVEPGSPAAGAGLMRGDTLVAIDGIDFINENDKDLLKKLNEGLYPSGTSQSHRLSVRRGTGTVDVTMVPAVVAMDPVKNAKVLDTPSGKVGYLTFNDHNAVSEKRLIDSFAMFKSAGVQDLVLDMRYNGGGLLQVASELATMIAGPSVIGKTFEQFVFNDRTAPEAPYPFPSAAFGIATPVPAQRGQALPTLGLSRVTILTSDDTCSASESVINGLRGVDVQVNLIGGQTCGKPYGFYPVENCGTTYFSINFKGANAKGFGDYPDGFAPTCAAADDLSHALGDPAEGMLAAALAYRSTNTCPAASSTGVAARAMKLVRPDAKDGEIHPRIKPGLVVR
jgi:carboxyl-terminal processing protease